MAFLVRLLWALALAWPAAVTPASDPAGAAAVAPPAIARFSYPIAFPRRVAGDGFFVRHGYAAENTWYNPGYWHTAEDWYAIDADTAGAEVRAVADGQVVYAGANYPGRVVIIRHAAGLYSMYGHLDPKLAVRNRQRVTRGTLLGVVLRRSDKTPNHLHFEIRTFLTTRDVNGTRPRYRFRCGVQCPPGPGYWPIAALDHPGAQGWRNPTHVINRRMFAARASNLGQVVVASNPLSPTLPLWSAPPGGQQRTTLGDLELTPGHRFELLAIDAGPEDARTTSAQDYHVWYRIRLPDGRAAWIQAAVPSSFETGSDGRPATVYFTMLPA